MVDDSGGSLELEQRVLAWLRKPTCDLSPEAHFVLRRFAPLWEALIQQVEHALVAQLVWEVRWDGRKDKFTVVLDDTAIAQEHARIKRSDEEIASRPKPRRSSRRKQSMRRSQR